MTYDKFTEVYSLLDTDYLVHSFSLRLFTSRGSQNIRIHNNEAKCLFTTIKMTEVSKAIGEVWSRLFDHRPFLNGEIKFILKEFEEKRNDREIANLFSILEKVTDIKDSQAPRIQHFAHLELSALNNKLEKALRLCENIDKESNKWCEANEKKLQDNRQLRDREWEKFIDDMTYKCKRIDNAFEEKEEELRDFYVDLDHKLNITK